MGKTFEALMKAEEEARRRGNRLNSLKDEESSATEDKGSGSLPSEETDLKETKGPLKTKSIPADSSPEGETHRDKVWREPNSNMNDAPISNPIVLQAVDDMEADRIKSQAMHRMFTTVAGSEKNGIAERDKRATQDIDSSEISEELRLLRKEFSNQKPVKIKRKLKRKAKKRIKDLITFTHPNSLISENFKMIRTRLLQSIKNKGVRTILVTSSLPGEGKSYTAANIAVSIAKGFEQHVLLVDSDSLKPSLQHIFGIDSDLGLYDFIASEEYELSQLIKQTKIPKLSILPAGTCFENSSELMASRAMTLFVQELKYRYDDRYIIFDAPPVTRSQALALAEKVDGAVVVIKAGQTDRNLVNKTIEMIGRQRVVGIIMNYCDIALRNYAGYYGKNGI